MEGIGLQKDTYLIVEYPDRDNIPKDVLMPYPRHHQIENLILPEVYYFNPELRFEWKASWSYYDLPVLSIYYQDIIVQRIHNASAEIVVLFFNEYKNIVLATIRERQVQTLWKENESLKNNLKSQKREVEVLSRVNTEVLSKIKKL